MEQEPGAARRLARRARLRTVVVGSLALVLVLVVLGLAQAVIGDRGNASPVGEVDNPLATGSTSTASASAAAARTDAPAATTIPATTPPATTAIPAAHGGPVPAVSRVPTNDRVIFLGIDDGLVRDPAVLDYMAANKIPFTMFLVTSALQADPAFWARARTVGGTVEAHTITHPNLTTVSLDQMRREICGSADAIAAATGVRPTLFRPPYGAYNDTVRAVAGACGYVAMVMWKGATNDGRVDLQEGVLKPGDVLLMHWRTDLLTNLQNVVALARDQGFRIARLEDYLEPVP